MAIDPKTLKTFGQIALGVGALGTAFTGAVSSNASSKKQYKYQSRLQEQAARINYDYSLKYLQNQYNAQRFGLESAGYNPMLAVQNGTGGANSSFTSAGQATAPDYTAGISTGVANAQSFQRLRNETEQANAITDNQYANADKAKAEANESVLRSKFIPDKEKSIIAQQNAQAKKLENDIHIADESLKLQEKLGLMGIATTKRGQDLVYNASTYSADTMAETMRGTRTDRLPFGIGSTYYDKRGGSYPNYYDDRKKWKEYYY